MSFGAVSCAGFLSDFLEMTSAGCQRSGACHAVQCKESVSTGADKVVTLNDLHKMAPVKLEQ